MKSSKLAKQIENGDLPDPFYITADASYVASDSIVTPYSGEKLSDPDDAFNFYQSSQRIVIECAFGILVQRWGVFWRPMKVALKHVGKVPSTAHLPSMHAMSCHHAHEFRACICAHLVLAYLAHGSPALINTYYNQK